MNKGTDTYSGYSFSANCRLINEIVDNLIIRSHNLCCKVDAMNKNRRRSRQNVLEVGVSSYFLASISNHMAEKSSPSCFGLKDGASEISMNAVEVKQLDERVGSLEEEVESIKQAFLESMEERKKLMNEIYQQFQVIQCCLCLRDDQVTGDKSCDGVLIINPSKDGRRGSGLSQILCRELNPIVVLRNLRSNVVAFQDPAEVFPKHMFTCPPTLIP